MAITACNREFCYYGHLSWITPLLTFIGVWCFLFPAFRCSLTIGRPPEGDPNYEDWEVYIGYWTREDRAIAIHNGPENDGNACFWWSRDSKPLFDGIWKFERWLAVIGTLSCIACACFNFCLIFMRFPLSWFFPLIVVHFLNGCMSMLLLLGLKSQVCANEFCKLARGMVVAIICAVIWWVAAMLFFYMRAIERDWPEPEGVDKRGMDEEGGNYPALPAPDDDYYDDKEDNNRRALPPSTTGVKVSGDYYNNGSKKERPLALPDSENSYASGRSGRSGGGGGSGRRSTRNQPSSSRSNSTQQQRRRRDGDESVTSRNSRNSRRSQQRQRPPNNNDDEPRLALPAPR